MYIYLCVCLHIYVRAGRIAVKILPARESILNQKDSLYNILQHNFNLSGEFLPTATFRLWYIILIELGLGY